MANMCPECKTDNPADSKFCKDCGTPLTGAADVGPTQTMETPQEELATGSTFADRYQIIEELGRGGMGRVYKALDTETREKIALKLIKPEIASDQKTVERFRQELAVARKIVHKNVCRMYDLGKDKGRYFITMEYIPGGDLKRFMRRSGQLSTGTTIKIVKQICQGLAEAHGHGIVHRDLKPNNIMIDDNGSVRIMDFGIARLTKGKSITGAGVMIGTPEYMSPEQAEGKDVSQTSDIYSLGVILYEMTTGRLPFEGESALGIAMKHKSEPPKNPKHFNAQIPDELTHVILKCLEKAKEDRYQKADEICLELENIEKGIPTTDRVIKRPLTSREITVQLNPRKILIPVVAVIAVCIIGLLLWKTLKPKASAPVLSDRPSVAVMYFENNTGDSSLDHWRKALSDLLITDLSQSRYLKVLSGEELFQILHEMNREDSAVFSSADLKEVARKGQVENIIVGKLLKAGEKFRIDVQIQKPGAGETVASERVEGVGDDSLFTMVDDLTRKIKSAFDFSDQAIAQDFDQDVKNITTDSPEALMYYVEGRKFHDAGDYRKSIAIMEKAVASDPDFAMAYRSLATSYANLGYSSEDKKYTAKAFDCRHKASERERLRIEAQYYRVTSESNWDKAIAAYEKLLELYPDEILGRTNFIIILYNLERYDRAWNELEKQPEKSERFYSAFWKAEILKVREKYDEAGRILQNYLESVSDHPNIRWGLSSVYVLQKKFEPALKEIDKSLAMIPEDAIFIGMKGDILLYRGDFGGAENVYTRLSELEDKIGPVYGQQSLGFLRLLEGRHKKALEHFQKAGDLALENNDEEEATHNRLHQVRPLMCLGRTEDSLKICADEQKKAELKGSFTSATLAAYMKGLTYILAGDQKQAEKSIDELSAIVNGGLIPKHIRYVDHLKGLLEMEKGHFEAAVDLFNKAIALLPGETGWGSDHALFMDSLGRAYLNKGDLDNARKQFDNITGLTTGRFCYGDIYAKSYYMLGKICEQTGNKDEEIASYEKFCDLWKDSDPGLPEFEDARKRLAGLKSR